VRFSTPGPLITPRDRTCPAQRTGQQPARARRTTSISSQNRMLRITFVRSLRHCEQNHTDKQAKNVPSRQPQSGFAVSGYRVSGLGSRGKNKEGVERSLPTPFPVVLSFVFPYTRYPNPETLFVQDGGSCLKAGQKCPDARPPISRGVRRTLSRTSQRRGMRERSRWAFFTSLSHQ
jgi:hypothetical protein